MSTLAVHTRTDIPTRPSPLLDTAGRRSLWNATPIGVGSEGESINLELPFGHLLCAGLPRSGLTTAALNVALAAGFDPRCRLVVADARDGRDWAGFARLTEDYMAGTTAEVVDDLAETLTDLVDVMDRRREALDLAPGVAPDAVITPTITGDPCMGTALVAVVIDGLDVYLDPTVDRSGEIDEAIGRLLTDGGPVGIIVVATTNRPDDLRHIDRFTFQFITHPPTALHGRDPATAVFARAVASVTWGPGLGVLVVPTQPFCLVRSYHLDHRQVAELVEQARRVRVGADDSVAVADRLVDDVAATFYAGEDALSLVEIHHRMRGAGWPCGHPEAHFPGDFADALARYGIDTMTTQTAYTDDRRPGVWREEITRALHRRATPADTAPAVPPVDRPVGLIDGPSVADLHETAAEHLLLALDGEIDAIDTYEAAHVAALRAIAHSLLSIRNEIPNAFDDLAERLTEAVRP